MLGRRWFTLALGVVCASVSLSCSHDTTACTVADPADSLGVALGAVGPDIPDNALDAAMARVAESGADWVRMDIDWSGVQPTRDRFDWSAPDRVVASAQAHGLRVLGVIAYTPQWARDVRVPAGDTHGRPADPQTYAEFAAATAQHYAGRISDWELWNEPNLTQFFTPAPDPAYYARMVDAASAAIRRVSPVSTIVSGGLSPAVDNGSDISPVTFLDQLYQHGRADSFDVVGIHPYSYPALPSDESTSSWNTFYRMRTVHEIMERNGDSHKPVWATEFGAPTGTGDQAVDPERQAEILTDGVNEYRRLGFVSKLFVYSIQDRGTDRNDREQNFGLVGFDGTPKPAFDVLRRAASTKGCL